MTKAPSAKILGPSLAELIARAKADLRAGVPVVLRESAESLMILAAEVVDPARLDLMGRMGARPFLALTDWRARTLKLAAYDGDLARIWLPDGADIAWLAAMADPKDDLDHPLKGPFATLRGAEGGGAELARLGVALAKAAHLLPAVVGLSFADGGIDAAAHHLTELPVAGLAEELARDLSFAPVVAARLPMAASEAGRVQVFRPEQGGDEHYAIEIGRPDRSAPVLVRLHSACFTGDVLGSLKCDCGPQLRGALAQMGREGAGVLLYLNQEGRGIGLANKLRAYRLQDQGFDTVEANHRLGFADDERDFRIGAALLREMGFRAVRLLTNNPAKVAMMQASGIEVRERVPLIVEKNRHNADYLATKAKKSGHIL